MQVEYIGPHTAVEVDVPEKGWQRCDRGAALEVPDDFGRSLLEQGSNWKAAGKRSDSEGESDGGGA